jgi:ATP-binding cassette subfamily B protein
VLIRLLREYLRPYRRPIVIVVLLQLVQTLATLLLPTLNADIIDNGVVTGDTGYILRVGGVMLGVSLVQVVCQAGAVFFGARTATALGRDVRASLFQRVQSFSTREVGQFGTPSLITRTTNDVQQVQLLVLMTLTIMVSAPIMCIGGILLAVHIDVQLSSLLLVAIPVLAVIVTLIISRMRPLFRLTQERLDLINRVLREQIAGVRVVRAFVRDTHEQERFARANTELFQVSLGVGRLLALMFPSVMLVLNVSSVAVLWFGGHQVGSGRGNDVATVGGAVVGGAVGANVGRNSGSTTQDVQRCNTVSEARPEYWDVTYNFRGLEHRVQMSAPPGPTITVNENGDPRA